MNTTDNSAISILIVDDEDVVLDMLKNLLKGEGYNVLLARNCREAVEQLRRHSPPVALIDKNLPDGTGLELVSQQKKNHPNTEFIVITAYSSLDSAVQAMKAGAFSYMTKPFNDIEDVLKRVQSALAVNKIRVGK